MSTDRERECTPAEYDAVPLYFRVSDPDDCVLGEASWAEEHDSNASATTRRCFNCGSPTHTVAECPEPLDRALIALSRQLFAFLHPDPAPRFRRVHEAEASRRLQLEWLDAFEPGAVRGAELRDALGLREGDVGERVEWLGNMACWGYPPGWVSVRDPREHVWRRIVGGLDEEDEDEDNGSVLKIFGDENDERPPTEESDMKTSSDTDSDKTLSTDGEPDSPAPALSPIRWASYPDTYFLPSKLPVYNGHALPSLGADLNPPKPSSSVSATYTQDRHELWQSILASASAPASAQAGVARNAMRTDTSTVNPPWRQSGAFGDGVPHPWPSAPPPPPIPPPPPPPSTPPPPPPPSSPPSPPPPPPTLTHPSTEPLPRHPLPPAEVAGGDSEDDMDLSD